MRIDPGFRDRVAAGFGERGREWLSALPTFLEDIASEWQLDLGEPVSRLNVNYVCYCTGVSGESLVLKTGVPHRDLETEIEALEHYDGEGIARAVKTDRPRYALLLERVHPGRLLHELKDNVEESKVIAQVLQKLVRPAPEVHGLPFLIEKLKRKLSKARNKLQLSPDFPSDWIDLAEQVVADCTTEESDYLLHGDLHHGNILFDDVRGWIAIDPKGLVGPGRIEVARSTYNFLSGPPEMFPMQFSERVAILADKLEDDRVPHWAMLDIVQCLCSEIGEPPSEWKSFLIQSARYVDKHIQIRT